MRSSVPTISVCALRFTTSTVVSSCSSTLLELNRTMRVLLTLALVALTTAFSPVVQKKTSTTKLALERRDVLAGLAGMVALPGMAHASSHALQNREGTHTHGSTFFFDDNIEKVREEAQMPTDGKVDLNNAAVVSILGRGEAIVRVRIRHFWH